jgi:hypothetical protein
MDPVLLFMIYRMLIVVGGISCIYFGYRLFYVVKTKQGDFKIKTGQNYELSLSDVAPGVLFALFGAGVLIFSLINGITIKPSDLDGIAQSQAMISNMPPSTNKQTGVKKPDNGNGATLSKIPCMSQRLGEC